MRSAAGTPRPLTLSRPSRSPPRPRRRNERPLGGEEGGDLLAGVDVRGDHDEAVALRVGDERGGGVEAHGLARQEPGVERGRVVAFEPGRGVDEVGEGGGVGFGEAEVREGLELLVDLVGLVGGDAVRGHPRVEARLELLHALGGSLGAHGPAQPVGLAAVEAGGVDGDLHELLLEQRHPERLLQCGHEVWVDEVPPRLAVPAAQVGVDRAALDGAGPDERDLDDEVVEVLGLQAREGRHLGAALDLEDAHGVGAAHHRVDVLVVGRQRPQVEPSAVEVGHEVGHAVQGLQHAQAEEVELDESGVGAVLFVPLEDGAVLHAGRFDRHDLGDRLLGEHHAAGVDAQVLGHVGEVGRRATGRRRGCPRPRRGRCRPSGGGAWTRRGPGRCRTRGPWPRRGRPSGAGR